MPASIAVVVLLVLAWCPAVSESACARGCDLALGSYYVSPNVNLNYISSLFDISSFDDILSYSPAIVNKDSIQNGSRINVSFPCDCIDGDFLGRSFSYAAVGNETYDQIAAVDYANLTTSDMLSRFNSDTLSEGRKINVVVTCACGNLSVSRDYGLFVTYPLKPGDSLNSLAYGYGFSGKEDLLQRYNPGMNFSAGKGIVFIPTKGLSSGAIAGICASAAGLSVSVCVLILLFRRKNANNATLPAPQLENNLNFDRQASPAYKEQASPPVGGSAPFTGITIDKSVEFSYEELAKATNNFDSTNKIGEGGYGAVYYAELREKVAIKKMDMQASREFLAELKVLTHVHHLNLVRLIGYCIESSLFLVYEYIENGNLNQHLHESGGRDPLPWSARVQIALDSARGLEYIHEHTVPVYIHRDIKSANILIDRNFHGKVADFGLAKLTEVASTFPTRLVGTFGYMPPEYAQYGDVSPKVDVYAFGVVLYELISAKTAIIRTDESTTETRGLVSLFEGVLRQQEPLEELRSLVDPRLGDNYSADSVLKMAQLGRACTQENPQLRPTMRSIVVALMTLSASAEWEDAGSSYENKALLLNLMFGAGR